MKKLFFQRCYVAFMIIFKWDHLFVVHMQRDELIRFFKEEEIEFHAYNICLVPYNMYAIISSIADTVDEDDLTLMKAQFEANAEGYCNR